MSQFLIRELGRQLISAKLVAAPPTSCTTRFYNRRKIGKREVVGHGVNGAAGYADLQHFPMQAIRFRETIGPLIALKEKEKGHWKDLTIDEKKTLYRASFCQTYAEMNVPSGEWKFVLGWGFWSFWVSMLIYAWSIDYVYYDKPKSLTEECMRAQVQCMIDSRMDPIEGISSQWDYENNRWKD